MGACQSAQTEPDDPISKSRKKDKGNGHSTTQISDMSRLPQPRSRFGFNSPTTKQSIDRPASAMSQPLNLPTATEKTSSRPAKEQVKSRPASALGQPMRFGLSPSHTSIGSRTGIARPASALSSPAPRGQVSPATRQVGSYRSASSRGRGSPVCRTQPSKRTSELGSGSSLKSTSSSSSSSKRTSILNESIGDQRTNGKSRLKTTKVTSPPKSNVSSSKKRSVDSSVNTTPDLMNKSTSAKLKGHTACERAKLVQTEPVVVSLPSVADESLDAVDEKRAEDTPKTQGVVRRPAHLPNLRTDKERVEPLMQSTPCKTPEPAVRRSLNFSSRTSHSSPVGDLSFTSLDSEDMVLCTQLTEGNDVMTDLRGNCWRQRVPSGSERRRRARALSGGNPLESGSREVEAIRGRSATSPFDPADLRSSSARARRGDGSESGDELVMVDARLYRHLVSETTHLKAALLRLRRTLHQVDLNGLTPDHIPLDVITPGSSISASGDASSVCDVTTDSLVQSLTQENQVLRDRIQFLEEEANQTPD